MRRLFLQLHDTYLDHGPSINVVFLDRREQLLIERLRAALRQTVLGIPRNVLR